LNTSDSGWGQVVGSFEHNNEPWGFVKRGKFFD